MSDSIPGTQAVARAIRVLRIVAQGRTAGASLGDVSRETGLSKPTAHRLLLALVVEALVEQDAAGRYYLGSECYVLGRIASERFGIDRTASDCVARLAQESGDSAFFSLRRDVYAVCVQREDGSYPLKTHVLQPGSRHLLGAGAGSLAMLAALPDEYIEAFVQSRGQQLEQTYENLSVSKLRAGIATARERGFAVNEGLVVPGSWGVGVAIRAPDGDVVGALSIAAVDSRLPMPRQAELGARLIEEATLLETNLRQREALRKVDKVGRRRN